MFCCPTFLYLECDSLPKMYIYELWAFFLALCQREVFIYSCCRLKKWLILWLQAAPSQQLEGMPKGSLCSLCEMVVSLLKPIVDSNSTEVSGGITTVCCLMICDTLNVIVNPQAEVQQIMNAFCGILPSNYSTKVLICPSLSCTIHFPFSLCMSLHLSPSHTPIFSLRHSFSYSYYICKLPLLWMQCHTVVTQYFPLIWELLETYVVSV